MSNRRLVWEKTPEGKLIQVPYHMSRKAQREREAFAELNRAFSKELSTDERLKSILRKAGVGVR